MLAYDDRGAGPPVVFLHGITCDMAHWGPVVSLLPELRCVRMDLPGHGATGGEAGDLFMQAAAVHEVVEHLELARPVVVGHSAGGFTALVYALTRSARGLVIVDQPLDVVAFASRIAPLRERLEDGDRFHAAFAEFIAHFRADLVPAERQGILRDHIQPRQSVVLKMWEQLIVGDPEEAKAQVEASLPGLGVPSLHLYTTEWSEEEGRLVGLAPHARTAHWDGFGHFVQLEAPGLVADRIRTFVHSIT